MTSGDELRRTVVTALLLGRRELRRNGTAVPPEFDLVVEMFIAPGVVTSSQECSLLAPEEECGDAAFMTIKETARRLRISASTVRRLIAGGELDVRRAGRRVLIPVAAVQEFGERRAG
ncbi:helix-turn-helix domain-containing protein [Pseudonocardia charpentierae]|uniref:Helix-turn-helix domain-containing protein n=1 Tax=Pseudonocardia charpentierae TaxID=3075545 RepID=A0ABU2NID4_9PSEU|nr:helix-turn-helix domain-containing protein [Pseudonocardia sp. DSM 45834]MDT0353730.1 helix-turn-helix domain-containing protein [Pseudonocardia sp. DSM 45834]